jgi:hypothetical protein
MKKGSKEKVGSGEAILHDLKIRASHALSSLLYEIFLKYKIFFAPMKGLPFLLKNNKNY